MMHTMVMLIERILPPDAVSPMSEQHECCQPYPDSETQYELFVRRELLMLDQCSAEYRLYNEGRCSIASDGTVCDPDGLVLSRPEPEMKKTGSFDSYS
ncbi:hypothetical protein [Aeromonas veronii]|uniref:hypothetical protein n=1 Tax=Aeromonas veronii TaxID=654 RepID=UPI0024467309|nr:hypothetical protein [Aeromonas veronii]